MLRSGMCNLFIYSLTVLKSTVFPIRWQKCKACFSVLEGKRLIRDGRDGIPSKMSELTTVVFS